MRSYAYRAHHAAFVCIHIQCAYICIQTHSYAFMYSVKIRSSLASLVVLSVGQPIFSAMLEVMDPADSHLTLCGNVRCRGRGHDIVGVAARYREPVHDISTRVRYRAAITISRILTISCDPPVTPRQYRTHRRVVMLLARVCAWKCRVIASFLQILMRSDFPVDGEKTTRWHQLPWHVPWSRASMWLRSKAPQRVALPRHGRSWRPPRAPLRAS